MLIRSDLWLPIVAQVSDVPLGLFFKILKLPSVLLHFQKAFVSYFNDEKCPSPETALEVRKYYQLLRCYKYLPKIITVIYFFLIEEIGHAPFSVLIHLKKLGKKETTLR